MLHSDSKSMPSSGTKEIAQELGEGTRKMEKWKPNKAVKAKTMLGKEAQKSTACVCDSAGIAHKKTGRRSDCMRLEEQRQLLQERGCVLQAEGLRFSPQLKGSGRRCYGKPPPETLEGHCQSEQLDARPVAPIRPTQLSKSQGCLHHLG